jgi:hypothetical protein
MSEQWHYRIFGQDFGPIRFDELKQLAEAGTISRGDEVRPESSTDWMVAENVHDLVLPASEDLLLPSDESASAQSVSDEWYCRFDNQELGPLSFEELVEFTKGEQLSANDDVKLGVSGKWRRVGSIGRLVAVLPYQEVAAEPQAALPNPPTVPAAVRKVAVPAIPPTPVAEAASNAAAFDRDIVRAEAAAEATELVVRRMIGFTLSPGCDSSWWVAINGAESGPVAFAQLFELALNGHLKPGDFIRNGMYGQYTHAANLPGLFVAVALVRHSREAIELVKAKAAEALKQSLAAKAPPVVVPPVAAVPTPTPARPTRSTPAAEIDVKRPLPEQPSAPAPSEARQATNPSVSSGSYGSMASTSTPYRPPTPTPKTFKPKQKESSNSPISMALGLLNTPAGKGAIAALVLVLAGWTYMANRNNGDIRRYKALKRILDDVRAKRFVKSTEVEEIKTRAKKVSEELIPQLKGSSAPVKKALLAAASDDLPKMMQQDLATESTDEKNFVKRLNEAKKILGLK